MRTSLALASLVLAACTVEPPPTPPSTGEGEVPMNPSDDGDEPMPPGNEQPNPPTNPSSDAPPPSTAKPIVSRGSSCGAGVQPLTLTVGANQNGCAIAPNTKSGCPAIPPAGQTLDAVYRGCFIAAGGSDCTLGALAFVECPVGATGPLDTIVRPPAGQAGYGFSIRFTRTNTNGTITVSYEAFEVGVNSDGTVAWASPHVTGTAQTGTNSCCAQDYRFAFPASGRGAKYAVDLQWF